MSKSLVGVIDYGMGNLLSVCKALEALGADPIICKHPKELTSVDRLVLPGVGAFGDCIANLDRTGFVEALNLSVIERGRPILGVCLGMQVMAKRGFEDGEYAGLGWFDADVIRLHPDDSSLRVPHIGWNDISYCKKSKLFARLPSNPDFYFVHSYYMKCNDKADVVASFSYGGVFTAAVRKKNIFATQFHPEKSQDYGLKVIENFLEWEPGVA